MSALVFNPQLPVARRAPRSARRPSTRVIHADALLDTPAALPALLDALASARCTELTVDFHTLGQPGSPRAARLAALVEAVHARGIELLACFTLGLDHDDPGCFERLVEWVETRRIAHTNLRLWTPAPGSREVRELAHLDRVRHSNFAHWDGAHVVITPAQMSAQTLYRGWVWAQLRLGSLASVWRRRPRGLGAIVARFVRALGQFPARSIPRWRVAGLSRPAA